MLVGFNGLAKQVIAKSLIGILVYGCSIFKTKKLFVKFLVGC